MTQKKVQIAPVQQLPWQQYMVYQQEYVKNTIKGMQHVLNWQQQVFKESQGFLTMPLLTKEGGPLSFVCMDNIAQHLPGFQQYVLNNSVMKTFEIGRWSEHFWDNLQKISGINTSN